MTRRPPALLYLRALGFWAVFVSSTLVYGLLVSVFGWLLSQPRCYRICRSWAALNIHALRRLCGVGWRIEGLEHVPDEPVVILAKHQSTWETLATVLFLPPHVWVVKRELLRIPFFGWGLAVIRPIAIDRSAGRAAVEQLVEQGRQRLAEGRSVLVFPEGTRVRPGTTTHRYRMGGAVLAARTRTPVLPIAHNAGEYWPRHSFIKWPGTIDVVIGPMLTTAGKTPEQVNAEASAWIEHEMRRISGRGPAA